MSLLRSPVVGTVQTRSQKRGEAAAAGGVAQEGEPSTKPESVGVEMKSKHSTRTFSASVKRRQLLLQYQAAEAEAQAELEAAKAEMEAKRAEAEAGLAKVKARVEKQLLGKKLAAQMAEVEDEDSRASFKSSHNSQKVENWLDKSNKELDARSACAPIVNSTDRHFDCNHHCYDANQHIDANKVPGHILTRLATSKDLPFYAGDPMEWLQFREAFHESTRICGYSDIENVWRLRKCLKGEAKEAVAALLIGGTTPKIILETFDAASKSGGYCLNDFLLCGHDLLCSLYGIMFRFREYPVGVMGDIKDMFLRIKIRDEDQGALRFLWKEPGGPVEQYAMTSLIFGANCSPFVAQFVNQNKNASRFASEMPAAVHAIQNNQYMDDYIDSFEDCQQAATMIKEVTLIHQSGGFSMCNWQSNKSEALSDVPKELLSDKAPSANFEKRSERVLGLLWYPADDTFGFDVPRVPEDILKLTRKPTKREMLKIIMAIYDVHGFLNPFTIKAKILLQHTWKLNIKWDEEIFEELYMTFCDWITQLKTIHLIRIPRWYFNKNNKYSVLVNNDKSKNLQLHIFCDASPRAYAAVAYWRKQYSDGRVYVCFVASKCRVAPTRPVTVPRLELQGALLACRLSESIKNEHRLEPPQTFYWCDSTTVLHWIRNEYRNYKIFIANRLGEIDELSKTNEWHYVPTGLNVADIATKSTSHSLHSESEWFTGPSFLYEDGSSWPREPEAREDISDVLEKLHTVLKVSEVHLPGHVPDPGRFSSWLRLLRATATVLLFVARCKKQNVQRLNDELIRKAERHLICYSQLQSFPEEINLIKNQKPLPNSSRLRTLTPILNNDMILRVGGRIGAAQDVSLDVKNPIILDGRNHVTRLIIRDYHIKLAHSFNETVVNELRQKYWILHLRPTVRTIAAQCLICKIRKATPKPPRMGDLPLGRLMHHQRPFTICGIDLFGPIMVSVGRQRHKRYGVLFTCLTVRAVHIELTSDLTADALIMAVRRMSARRGWPRQIFSDNGTNLRGADLELKKSYLELDKEALVEGALNKGVEWKFIPPGSPHMGGAWERLIKTVKSALRVVLKERAPREETLMTLLTEVENMVNSRPLTHVSVEPHSNEALTPNHFLIGSSSNLPIAGVFNDSDLYLRKQWRFAQRLADLFWSRWMKEVLPTLLPRKKWYQDGAQVKVEDLVIIVDPTMPRNCWPKGIVKAVFPGADGRVRVATVQTRLGALKRPASRLAVLMDECRNDDTWGEDVDDGSRLTTV